MDSIRIGTPPKSSYGLNESTANAGGTIIVVRKAGNEDAPIAIQDSWISNLTTNTVGSRNATVTYTLDGITKTTTYPYSVANNITGITVKAPDKTTYKHGENLDLTGGTITVKYADNSTQTRTMTTSMITENRRNSKYEPSNL